MSAAQIFCSRKISEGSTEKLHDICPAAKGKKVMLYAPTFRGSVGGAKAPDAMDLCLMQEKLGKDWIC